jgi:serine/threonine-protein kinase HipA
MATAELHAYLDGIRAGTFTQTAQGSLGFEYDEDYRQRRGATPMSLSMPLTRRTHRNATARAYLQGLLPDNPGRLEELGILYRVSPRNPFALLQFVGRDAPGAVQLLGPGDDSPDAATRAGDVDVHTDEEVGEIIGDLVANADTWGRRESGRWSLPGAQPKVAFLKTDDGRWATPRDATPTTHILKPAVHPYTAHHINEFMTMQAAGHLGLEVASSDLIQTVGGHHVFISARYDREKRGGQWRRRHQEDLCQALAVPPAGKYQKDGGPGVAKISELFLSLPSREDRDQNAIRFLGALAFNLAAAGTDAHAKNYSLLLEGPRARLAPLYDLGTHAPYPTRNGAPFELAMSIDREYVMDRVGVEALVHAGRRLRVDEDRARERVTVILTGVADAFAQAADDARAVMGDDPRISKVLDAVTEYAGNRGWASAES